MVSLWRSRVYRRSFQLSFQRSWRRRQLNLEWSFGSIDADFVFPGPFRFVQRHVSQVDQPFFIERVFRVGREAGADGEIFSRLNFLPFEGITLDRLPQIFSCFMGGIFA